MWIRSLGQEDSMEEKMATHSSILAWEIPWAEESGGLQSMGLQRAGHDRASFTFFLGNSGGQSLACGSPRGHKESGTT